jgi:hypothetical protein
VVAGEEAAAAAVLRALPFRTGLQIASLLVVLDSFDLGAGSLPAPSFAVLAAVAIAVSAGAALANNSPASAAVSARSRRHGPWRPSRRWQTGTGLLWLTSA